jgi:hypothetical protein
LFSLNLFAQNKSVNKSAILSTACPGLGQVYNQKYWKAPVIIFGIGASVYSYQYYNNKFQKYKEAYIIRTDNDETTIDEYINLYSESNLITLQDYYRNKKDLSIIIGSIIYILNIVDAYVDAHLFTYNIDDDLSLSIKPELIANNISAGLISMKIKF